MFDILYTVFIYPIEFIMDMILQFSEPLFGYLGAVILLSLLVSIILLPLKKIASKLEQKEKDIQYAMYPAVLETKQKYSGAEQFNRLKTIYQRHNYHPIHSVRGLMGLLIQIPFFIAAFFLLSDYVPQNTMVLGLDLTQPDALFRGINILPFVMAILTIALAINARVQGWFERYGLAILFCVLLYTSPSALLIYWTLNLFFGAVLPVILKDIIFKK